MSHVSALPYSLVKKMIETLLVMIKTVSKSFFDKAVLLWREHRRDLISPPPNAIRVKP